MAAVSNIFLVTPMKISHKTNSFHKSLRFVIVISQWFGLFPVQGKNIKKLRFRWFSAMTIYSMYVLCGTMFGTCASLTAISRTGTFNIFEMNNTMFYLRGFFTWVIFIKIGRIWPALIKQFVRVETILRPYPVQLKLGLKLKILAAGIFFAAAVEYILNQVGNIQIAFKCENDKTVALRNYFVYISFPNVFYVIPYSIWAGILTQILCAQITFGWTFLDVFIVLTSVAFSSKIIQFREKISELINHQVKVESTWKYIREDYNKLFRLFRRFNDELHYMIILSFAINIYFVLTQLFGSLRMAKSDILHIYYTVSFALLIIRIVCVCFYGGSIYEESLNLIRLLITLPSGLYNSENERLILELNSSPMVLTGKNFFKITRSLILQIAGAIVTYELVLIQFSGQVLNNMTTTDTSC